MCISSSKDEFSHEGALFPQTGQVALETLSISRSANVPCIHPGTLETRLQLGANYYHPYKSLFSFVALELRHCGVMAYRVFLGRTTSPQGTRAGQMSTVLIVTIFNQSIFLLEALPFCTGTEMRNTVFTVGCAD